MNTSHANAFCYYYFKDSIVNKPFKQCQFGETRRILQNLCPLWQPSSQLTGVSLVRRRRKEVIGEWLAEKV